MFFVLLPFLKCWPPRNNFGCKKRWYSLREKPGWTENAETCPSRSPEVVLFSLSHWGWVLSWMKIIPFTSISRRFFCVVCSRSKHSNWLFSYELKIQRLKCLVKGKNGVHDFTSNKKFLGFSFCWWRRVLSFHPLSFIEVLSWAT